MRGKAITPFLKNDEKIFAHRELRSSICLMGTGCTSSRTEGAVGPHPGGTSAGVSPHPGLAVPCTVPAPGLVSRSLLSRRPDSADPAL